MSKRHTEATRERNAQPGTVKRLVGRMTVFPWLLTLIILGSILGNILGLLVPKRIGDAIDMIVAKAGVIDSQFIRFLILILGLILLATIFQYLTQMVSARLSARVIRRLRTDYYAKLNTLPLAFFDRTPNGVLTGLASTDIDQINDGLVSGLPKMFAGIVAVIGSLYYMFRIQPLVSLLIIGLTPVTYWISSFIARRSRDMYSEETRIRTTLNGQAEEMIDNHVAVRGLMAGDDFYETYAEGNEALHEVGRKAQFYSSLTNPSTRLVNATSYILVGTVSCWLAIQGKLTVGAIAALLTYANQFSKPINEITAVITQLQAAIASSDKIFEILDLEGEPDESDKPDLTVSDGKLNFDDVSFAYVSEKPLIEHLDLDIPAGYDVAVVGPTGAGKTTLVNLLMRFYELDGGRIVIDGQDIYRCNRKSVRRNFGMVLQDIWLFEGTVFENIAFSDPNATEAQVAAVCRSIGADDFIRRLPQGYDTVIGAETKLSEGQKQLLTIARAILQQPKLLILDEATSDIDTVTELKVQAAFAKMMEDSTSFIIAHRLSTVKDADLILVMNKGDIVERGTFATLMRGDTLFRELYESQFAGKAL